MRPEKKSQSIKTLALLLLAAWPDSLFACSACYGDPDSTMSVGLTWAITVLVGVVTCVLAGIVTFFVHSARQGSSETPAEGGSNSKAN